MAPHDQDPNRLDVSLSIMSDATLAAVNNLTNQLAGLRELIASQGADPGARAEAAGRAAQYVQSAVEGTPGAVPRRPNIQSPSDPSNPSQGAITSAERRRQLAEEYNVYRWGVESGGIPPSLSPQAQDLMMRQLSDRQRWKLAGQEKANPNLPNVTSRMDRFFELYPGVQRDPGEDRTFEDVSGAPRTGGSALPEGMGFGGGSYPPKGPPTTSGMGDMGDMPGWAQALDREGINPEARFGLTIPRLGEFTIQDKLNMAAQWMGRAAMRRQEGGDTGRGTQAMGRTAAGAAYLRDQSAALVEINREFQRLRGFARGEELTGEQLGFSRESALGDVELFGAGFRLNAGFTSAAQREALHQELTQRRVQAAPGVSGEEAQRIRGIVAGMGYSGDRNERLQYDLFRPLQQRGIAPESVAPLIDQGVRQGNMSIASLRDTMIAMADAARNANMTLEDVTESSLEYAESVQATGANYESALRNAATFTRSGLDPRIASQAMQSPMVQGQLMMQTGLPPSMQGIIGAPGVMQAMSRSIQQGLAMGAGFANMPDRTIETASGQRITTATGRDAQIAAAAQFSGMPRQIVERFMRNPNFLEAGGVAQTMVGQMQEYVRGQTNHEVTKEVADWTHVRRDAFGRPVPGRRTVTENQPRDLTAAQRRALESGSPSDSVIQYNELEQQMIAMDPKNKAWTDRVRKITKDHGNIEDRLRTASRIIGEATSTKPEPDYMLGLTPEAAKILKIVKPKDRDAALPRANAGGAPANAAMTGPGFPSSSGGAMQYGVPGG